MSITDNTPVLFRGSVEECFQITSECDEIHHLKDGKHVWLITEAGNGYTKQGLYRMCITESMYLIFQNVLHSVQAFIFINVQQSINNAHYYFH